MARGGEHRSRLARSRQGEKRRWGESVKRREINGRETEHKTEVCEADLSPCQTPSSYSATAELSRLIYTAGWKTAQLLHSDTCIHTSQV